MLKFQEIFIWGKKCWDVAKNWKNKIKWTVLNLNNRKQSKIHSGQFMEALPFYFYFENTNKEFSLRPKYCRFDQTKKTAIPGRDTYVH